MDVSGLVVIGLVARLALIVYGEWQDRTMAVKFTDIDYQVFNDAAGYMTQGKSPYLRATYRYTPLLAQMLQPNIWISPLFGKVLFIAFDVLTGYLIYKITLTGGTSAKVAKLCAAVWLFNPLPMTISSRGNAESIMSFLVLLCLKLLQDKNVGLAGCVYALSVHVKIYPVTYALPVYLLLGNDYRHGDVVRVTKGGWKQLFRTLLPNKDRLLFILTAGTTLAALTGVYYYWYGWDFLYHTYLYHITRKDIRHNFSVYFYMLYQQSGTDNSIVLSLLSFVPQVALLIMFSVKHYKHPVMAVFLNTFAFVTFNKVCTSQYFLWYLCIVPLLLPHLTRISVTKAITTVSLWFAGQGLWLLPAYYLEFEGKNTFIYIWGAGLIFFIINCYILHVVIDNYTHVPLKSDSYRIVSEKTETQSRKSRAENSGRTASDIYKTNSIKSNDNKITAGKNKIKSENKVQEETVSKAIDNNRSDSESSEDIVENKIWTRSQAWRRSHVTKHKFL